MGISLWNTLTGRFGQTDGPVSPAPIPRARPCIYDRLSEQRARELAAQRLLESHRPKSDFCSDGAQVEDVWVWLPGHQLNSQMTVADLARLTGTHLTHDPRLVTDQGVRRPLRRIIDDPDRAPSIDATERAIELLEAFLDQCALLKRVQDWAQTEIHLCTPSQVDELLWFETVVARWPQHQLPAWGFHTCDLTPSDWFSSLLISPSSAPRVLCLCIDSWVNSAINTQMDHSSPLSESVSLIALRRMSPATEHGSGTAPRLFGSIKLPPKAEAHDSPPPLEALVNALIDRAAIEPERIATLVMAESAYGNHLYDLHQYALQHLPHSGHRQSIRPRSLVGETAPGAAQWVHIALACLSARASPEHAHLVLDFTDPESTHGWVIA